MNPIENLKDLIIYQSKNNGNISVEVLYDEIRSIRTSERRIWQQITDIFEECSMDYDKDSEITYQFYAMIQNKFHYAITENYI